MPSQNPSTPARDSRVVAMPERLTREWVAESHLLRERPSGPLVLDFAATRTVDTAGVCLIRVLRRDYQGRGIELELRNVSQPIRSALEQQARGPSSPVYPVPDKDGFYGRIGAKVLAAWAEGVQAFSVLSETVYWSTLGLRKKRDFRKGTLGEQMYQLGYRAIGIVGLLSFLVGIVIALQSAMFLRTYGAGIFLASMIGWSMLKEFGPLLTAIILAGRTGSATTAEIATMGVGEEIDALKSMGISHYQFVIVPKFWAITLTMPLLSIVASAAGIFGAYLVSLLYLDIATGLFWVELCKYIALRDFLAGFIKSVVFAWLIIWIGSYYGLKVRGGAEQVGRETTASVVTCIFVIILADALFSFVL